jgi:hypothetical protein
VWWIATAPQVPAGGRLRLGGSGRSGPAARGDRLRHRCMIQPCRGAINVGSMHRIRPQCRPLCPPHRAPGDANSLAHLPWSLLHHRPQRQRHGDRRERVMPSGRHATWHDQDQRLTPQAAIATTPNQGLDRCRVSVRRPKDLAVTPPVPVQPQATPGRSTWLPTSRTQPRTSSLDRRGLYQPPLDVEPAVNDE